EETKGAMEKMRLVRSQLFGLLVPSHVKVDLRTGGLFLEIGIDEALLNYPWELMHDGEDFLCEKHYLGRFVNVTERPIPPSGDAARLAPVLKQLKVLVIGVPRPVRKEQQYDNLSEVHAELDAITQTLDGIPGVKFSTLIGKEATFDNVYTALRNNRFHIVHYSGHAHFDS